MGGIFLLFYLYISIISNIFCFLSFFQLTPERLKIPSVTRASITRSQLMRDMERKPDKDSGLHPSRGHEFICLPIHTHTHIYIYGYEVSNCTPTSPSCIRLWVYQLQAPCPCFGCTTLPQQQSNVFSSYKGRVGEERKTTRERYCYFSKIMLDCGIRRRRHFKGLWWIYIYIYTPFMNLRMSSE